MTSTTMFSGIWQTRSDTETAAPKPRPRPKGPVFIADSVIPCNHTTLLLTLWRDWEDASDEDT